MNQTQVKYALQRATAIYNKLRADIQNKYKPQPFTNEERLDALEKGAFSLDRSRTHGGYNWANAIIFDEETKVDLVARDKELSALHDKYVKINDELVLGDNEEAVRLLKEFENL